MGLQRKLSTEPYKGVRDLYPEEMFIHNHLAGVLRTAVERFGYEEYGASILEPAELYMAKSNEEIVEEQTYTFTDRGGREVTLRPEMTPTLARMVAARRKTLSFPLRWYSFANMFRYERPQRGRLREHWQLNVDLFGVAGSLAEAEVISVAVEILRSFGLTDAQFEVRIGNRKIILAVFNEVLKITGDTYPKMLRLIDRKEKLSSQTFEAEIEKLLGERKNLLLDFLEAKNLEWVSKMLTHSPQLAEVISEVDGLLVKLNNSGVSNCRFDSKLVRGFDYYTGSVFELYDLNPKNRRSICGGGRYDDLLIVFGVEPIPAVGFGLGDIVLCDVLETYGLLPSYRAKGELYLCIANSEQRNFTLELARKLRSTGLKVAVDFTERKLAEQIRYADKKGFSYICCIGPVEVKQNRFKLKHLSTRTEKELSLEEISVFVRTNS